jgi:hypothetical protein
MRDLDDFPQLANLPLGRWSSNAAGVCQRGRRHQRRGDGADEKDRAQTSRRRAWGRHVALFYERKDDLTEICVPFLTAGLESNEVCVWLIAEPLSERDAWRALGDSVPALDRYRADLRIEILQSQTNGFEFRSGRHG